MIKAYSVDGIDDKNLIYSGTGGSVDIDSLAEIPNVKANVYHKYNRGPQEIYIEMNEPAVTVKSGDKLHIEFPDEMEFKAR